LKPGKGLSAVVRNWVDPRQAPEAVVGEGPAEVIAHLVEDLAQDLKLLADSLDGFDEPVHAVSVASCWGRAW
jgi:hypothetical protein